MGLFASLITGALVGWIAGRIMHSRHGILGKIIIGLLGGAIGGVIFDVIGFAPTGWTGYVITGVVGACALIWLIRKL